MSHSVRELRAWATTLGGKEFRHQVGPFVLIQRPPDPVLQQAAMKSAAGRTVGMIGRDHLVDQLLIMVRDFDSLVVATLPPMGDSDEIAVGRLPDCELVVDEPTVSKRHALLRWDAAQGGCSLQDLDSSNGTFVNAQPLPKGEEHLLADGDTLSFGDAEFLYFLADSLYAQLAGAGLAKG